MNNWKLDLGANSTENGETRFKVWAPFHDSLSLKILKSTFEIPVEMTKDAKGYFHTTCEGLRQGDLYSYLLEGKELPDPVSRSLPFGVSGPTEIIDPNAFTWSDQSWKGVDRDALIFYECHVGTFTPQGTFEGIIEKLPYLKDLGITCLELMPIAEFPGMWNWGYDGSSLYAPHHMYGRSDALKKLIDECHKMEMAIALDVVYNHFGPEGSHVVNFGPYLTDKYKTPWGQAINFDGAYSDEVRHFFLQNALYWLLEYHIDVLRLDALHTLFDFNATSFLSQLSEEVEKHSKTLGRKIYLVAEDNLNDSLLISPRDAHGQGINALWNDDFHHALHVSFTGEKVGYYEDFSGLEDVEKALKEGVVYDGKYSTFHKRTQGNSFQEIDFNQLIVFLQNHDQIGNRPLGDRLSTHLSFEGEKMAALLLILTPFLPLIFMGQEYGEEAPFEYFVDFANPDLMKAVYEGRLQEFNMQGGELPFPDEQAYKRSKLRWDVAKPQKMALLSLYKKAIKLRSKSALFKNISKESLKVYRLASQNAIAWELNTPTEWLGVFCSFSQEKTETPWPFQFKREGSILMHTEEPLFLGAHPPIVQEGILVVFGECGIVFTSTE